MKTRIYFPKIFILSILAGLSTSVFSQTSTFIYTGSVQTWTVPAGVTSIIIDAQGAAGGAAIPDYGPSTPGNGGRVQATLTVVPGQVLNIYVGQKGVNGNPSATPGGYNGGGNAVADEGGGGGGASDIRIGDASLTSRVLVAGGGGGAGIDGACSPNDMPGGNGGDVVGGAGIHCADEVYTVTNAGGGTQTDGGVGGNLCCGDWVAGNPGVLGIGGDNNSGGGIGGVAAAVATMAAAAVAGWAAAAVLHIPTPRL